jgi:hypothetical protein
MMEERFLQKRTFFADPVGYLEESILVHGVLPRRGVGRRWPQSYAKAGIL